MEGIVAVLKPPAMSSNDVVVDIRKLFGIKRVGHLGTLDPEAAGVLPVCVGRAVRLFDYLVDKQKEYTGCTGNRYGALRYNHPKRTADRCAFSISGIRRTDRADVFGFEVQWKKVV